MAPDAFEDLEILVEAALDDGRVRAALPARLRRFDLTQDLAELGEGAREDLLEGVVLGLEVEIESALRETRRPRDVLHLGAIEPALDEDALGCQKQAALGFGVARAGHGAIDDTDPGVSDRRVNNTDSCSVKGGEVRFCRTARSASAERLELGREA